MIKENKLVQQYELVLLVKPTSSDKIVDIIKAIQAENQDMTIHSVEDWGKKDLKYKIGKMRSCHYVLLQVICKPSTAQSLQTNLKHYRADVVRWMMVKHEGEWDEPSGHVNATLTNNLHHSLNISKQSSVNHDEKQQDQL